MMNTIMNMAKALGQSQPEPAPQQPSPAKQPPLQQKAPPPIGKNELEMISRISSLSQQTGLDRQEQALLRALNPYLTRDRLNKLEKAMHAAKMAKFASGFLNAGVLQLLTGR